jgi:ABC-type maltose transport system permease subunit
MDATRGRSLLPVLMLYAAAPRYVVEGASQAGLKS